MAEIEELRALLAEATPGPWIYDGCSLSDFGREFSCSMSMEWLPNGRADEENSVNQLADHDGKLIAAARNNLEPLLDRLSLQEKQIERLREALGFSDDWTTDDASLNLQGALDDLQGRFDPKDGGVCARTISRVIGQLERARQALNDVGGA